MDNPLARIYESLDTFLVYNADRLVKVWNWTTGRTKTDLANILQFTAPAFEISGISSVNPLGIAFAPLYISMTLFQYSLNKKQKVEENLIKDKEIKINPFYEQTNKFLGSSFITVGIGTITLSSLNPDNSAYSIGIGNCIRGVSCYVMRADSPPPRKNVLSRARDTLAEFIQSYRQREAAITIPVTR